MFRLRSINFLDALITSALAAMLPLYLAYRGLDIVSIAFIIAWMPVIFTLSRMLFASIADQIGLRPFFALNGVANAAASLAYLFSLAPAHYAAGRFLEGIRGGAIWAVTRTAAARITREKRAEVETSKLSAIRTIAYAAGTILGGILVLALSFEGTFMLLAALGLAIAAISLTMPRDPPARVDWRGIANRLDFRKLPARLKETAVVMMFGMPGTSLVLNMLLALYLFSLGLDYAQIGIAFAVWYLANAAVVPIALKFERSFKRIAAYSGIFSCAGMLAIPLVGPDAVFLPVALAGVGDGLGSIVWEALIMGSARARSISTDIGWVHVPAHFLTGIMLAIGGIFLASYGYFAAFALAAAFFALYAFLSRYMLNS